MSLKLHYCQILEYFNCKNQKIDSATAGLIKLAEKWAEEEPGALLDFFADGELKAVFYRLAYIPSDIPVILNRYGINISKTINGISPKHARDVAITATVIEFQMYFLPQSPLSPEYVPFKKIE